MVLIMLLCRMAECGRSYLVLFVFSFSPSSYGSVYKAYDKRDGKLVAIKVLEVENEDTAELQKEINILRECDCEWIVKYKGSYRKDGNIWIVMVSKLANLHAALRAFLSVLTAGRFIVRFFSLRVCFARNSVVLDHCAI